MAWNFKNWVKICVKMVVLSVEFLSGEYKIRKNLPKNFGILRLMLPTNVRLNLYSSMKKLKKIPMIF